MCIFERPVPEVGQKESRLVRFNFFHPALLEWESNERKRRSDTAVSKPAHVTEMLMKLNVGLTFRTAVHTLQGLKHCLYQDPFFGIKKETNKKNKQNKETKDKNDT